MWCGTRWVRFAIALFIVLVGIGIAPASAFADDAKIHSCVGPDKCCPSDIISDETPPRRKPIRVGVVLVGINDINEKTSTWTADFYLYEEWTPAPGFVPQTEIHNEVSRVSETVDRTELKGDRCLRSRRVRTTLHTGFNLRTFPFDHQTLRIELTDAEFDSLQAGYPKEPWGAGMDERVFEQLSAWRFDDHDVTYGVTQRPFKWEDHSPNYDYATFDVHIRRHVSFHLTKYFLPLLLIVIVSFSVFWIDPEDLSSAVAIGVTCLLAAVALEFTEASALPDVNYLTISDRTFSISYVAIGLAVVQTVYTNRLVRSGKKEKALRVDWWSRFVFPAGLVIALGIAWLRAYTQQGS